MIATMFTSGEGINLQHFNRVIVSTPDWNPAAEERAICRVHRIGQTKKVYVTRYYHEPIEKMSERNYPVLQVSIVLCLVIRQWLQVMVVETGVKEEVVETGVKEEVVETGAKEEVVKPV